MSKDTNKITKEPLKSFINKVGTFRGKKSSQRPSTSDLTMAVHDESIMKNSSDEQSGNSTCEPSDLDTTTKSSYNGSHSYSYRLDFLVQ